MPKRDAATQEDSVHCGGGGYPTCGEFMNQRENEIIAWALNRTNHNITAAAELLGIPRSTLRSKLGTPGNREGLPASE